jgi:putative transposase
MGNPGHLESFDYIGVYRYFLTFCTDARTPVFASADRVDLVLRQFLRSASDEAMAILAYCFMPDHLHVLAEGRSECADCRAFIKRAKQYSGFYYKQAFRRRLWQRYGFERVLRDDEATLSVARYILENPVRARLVTRAEDYPFTGSEVYTVAEILAAVQMDGWPNANRSA